MGTLAAWSSVAGISAVVAGKWAMELGFNQFRQLLWMIAGLMLGPLALLVLYVRMLYQRSDNERLRREMSKSLAQDL